MRPPKHMVVKANGGACSGTSVGNNYGKCIRPPSLRQIHCHCSLVGDQYLLLCAPIPCLQLVGSVGKPVEPHCARRKHSDVRTHPTHLIYAAHNHFYSSGSADMLLSCQANLVTQAVHPTALQKPRRSGSSFESADGMTSPATAGSGW